MENNLLGLRLAICTASNEKRCMLNRGSAWFVNMTEDEKKKLHNGPAARLVICQRDPSKNFCNECSWSSVEMIMGVLKGKIEEERRKTDHV